jgi:aspartate aminotransferase
MKFAERMKAAKPSVTLALNARAQAMAAEGRDVVSLAAGEPDFNTPEHIGEAAYQAIKQGFTKYTATRGIPELRKAITEKLSKENELSYTPEQVLVSCGAKHTLYNAFQALFDVGDEVVIFAPYWVSYPDMARLAGATPVFVQTRADEGFVPRPEALRAALTPRTKAVIFNSPCNPTGAFWSGDALEALGKELLNHDCVIISDDIYEHLLYSGRFEHLLQRVPQLKERTLVVNGVSKTFAMTGWRIGYGAGPKELIDAMGRLQDNSTSNPNSIAQKAALAALTGPMETVKRMRTEFDTRRKYITQGLRALPGVSCVEPLGAFYALPNVSAWFDKSYRGERVGNSSRLAEILLNDYEMATVPGEPFGAPEHLRLSFAASMTTLEKALARLEEFARQLK